MKTLSLLAIVGAAVAASGCMAAEGASETGIPQLPDTWDAPASFGEKAAFYLQHCEAGNVAACHAATAHYAAAADDRARYG